MGRDSTRVIYYYHRGVPVHDADLLIDCRIAPDLVVGVDLFVAVQLARVVEEQDSHPVVGVVLAEQEVAVLAGVVDGDDLGVAVIAQKTHTLVVGVRAGLYAQLRPREPVAKRINLELLARVPDADVVVGLRYSAQAVVGGGGREPTAVRIGDEPPVVGEPCVGSQEQKSSALVASRTNEARPRSLWSGFI